VILTVHRRWYVEIKCQLDATDIFLLQILLLAQHVSDTIMPIIRNSTVFYSWLPPVVFGAWFSSCRYGVVLRGQKPANRTQTLSSTPYRQLENQAPKTTGGNQLYNTLEFLMMGIMVSQTCWASNKICNKKTVVSSWHFISTYKFASSHTVKLDILIQI
jgi:hypothetical protein